MGHIKNDPAVTDKGQMLQDIVGDSKYFHLYFKEGRKD